jgi:hypothetical protein
MASDENWAAAEHYLHGRSEVCETGQFNAYRAQVYAYDALKHIILVIGGTPGPFFIGPGRPIGQQNALGVFSASTWTTDRSADASVGSTGQVSRPDSAIRAWALRGAADGMHDHARRNAPPGILGAPPTP